MCLGTVQLPQDLYSDEVYRKNNTMISPTIKLNLYNPEKNSMLTENQLSSLITILLPLEKGKYNSNHSTQVSSPPYFSKVANLVMMSFDNS